MTIIIEIYPANGSLANAVEIIKKISERNLKVKEIRVAKEMR